MIEEWKNVVNDEERSSLLVINSVSSERQN